MQELAKEINRRPKKARIWKTICTFPLNLFSQSKLYTEFHFEAAMVAIQYASWDFSLKSVSRCKLNTKEFPSCNCTLNLEEYELACIIEKKVLHLMTMLLEK